MGKLAIVHFQPLEEYPPVTNCINYINRQNPVFKVKIFTTKPNSPQQSYYQTFFPVLRYGGTNHQRVNRVGRLGNYLLFYLKTTLALLKYRPSLILYFETLSFLPVYIYVLLAGLAGKNVRIFCHYHEYTSPDEYENGMFLNRVIHKAEQRLYSKMKWISHTNEDRMFFFKRDNPFVVFENTHILPNFPPEDWLNEHNTTNNIPLRIVYVGALGMDTMYIKEFAKWVESQRGRVNWDIYTQQNSNDLLSYLQSINSKNIYFKGKINYYDLPEVLKNYNVGVILYKGHIPNYIYNAPNKLFEYYACGLDIWFPVEMKSSHKYIVNKNIPKIIPVNFKDIAHFDLEAARNHSGFTTRYSSYFCEKELAVIWDEILINI